MVVYASGFTPVSTSVNANTVFTEISVKIQLTFVKVNLVSMEVRAYPLVLRLSVFAHLNGLGRRVILRQRSHVLHRTLLVTMEVHVNPIWVCIVFALKAGWELIVKHGHLLVILGPAIMADRVSLGQTDPTVSVIMIILETIVNQLYQHHVITYSV